MKENPEGRRKGLRVRLDIPLSVLEIKNAVGYDVKSPGDANVWITHVTTSSEEAFRGDLFVPLKGKLQNGESYVAKAKKRGAVTISEIKGDILCKSTGDALLSIARYYKTKLPSLFSTVAITGSVGKTTTKEFLYRILSTKFCVHKSQGNYNNDIGLPLSILAAPRSTELLILEMGMNHIGEIARLTECASPDVAVITNIGTAHIGNLGSREEIAKAKLEIKGGGAKLIVPYGESLLNSFSDVSFSSLDKRADLFVTRKDASVLVYKRGKRILSAAFSPIGGQFTECLASAIAVATELNLSTSEIGAGISSIGSGDTRLKITPLGDFSIIEDYYNASLESFIADFKLMNMLGSTTKSSLIGTIMELGDLSKKIHYRLGREAAEHGLDKLYLIGEMSRFVKRGAVDYGFDEKSIFMASSNEDAARIIAEKHLSGEMILFKASRAIKLENCADILKAIYAGGNKERKESVQ